MKQYLIYLLLGSLLAPVLHFIEKYVFSDWEYMCFLFVITMVDTALGTYRAYLRKEISSRKFGALINKLFVYLGVLIATHVMINFTIGNKPYPTFSWFDIVIYSSIMVREFISIVENIAAIDPGVFSPSVLRYLKQFDSLTGKEKLSANATKEDVL